jgi:hypothetical protein
LSLDVAIQAAVRTALVAELPAVLRELQDRQRLVSIRDLPVGHRTILEAEKAGEIVVYRRGKFSAVDEADFISWMKRAPATAKPSQPTDDVGELLELSRERRAKRGGRAA